MATAEASPTWEDRGRTFEDRLVPLIQPIRNFSLAIAIHHLFESGLYDSLRHGEPATSDGLAERHGLEVDRLDALLRYLRNEGILASDGREFILSSRGRELADARPWYTMFIGGYASTFLQLGAALGRGAPAATRDAEQVGIGSCGISHHDAIPLTRRLMRSIDGGCETILDLGCGNALYLTELCGAIPTLRAWGVEPDPGGFQAALRLVQERGLQDRLRLTHGTASDFLGQPVDDWIPDAVVMGFVLHEILGQEGEPGVRQAFAKLVDRFPQIHLIVIEVDWRPDQLAAMDSGLALGYYNPYYLFHPFTRQRLQPASYWEALFAGCGLEIVDRQLVDTEVDSTGLEVGYLLRARPAARPAAASHDAHR
jgi:2-ketoarginine methyltransferase